MGKKLKTDIKKKKDKVRFGISDMINEIKGPIIRLCSNTEASVDGCKGVLDYYDNLIRLSIPNGTVSFIGNRLSITSFTESSAIITGCIEQLEYCVRAE